MEKKSQLYEGKAKKVFATDNPSLLIVSYKDDATAFNGLKKGTISGKGIINNRMSNMLMQKLEEYGVPTHFVEELSERETVVKKVTIVPLEVIVRNISAGSFSKRYGIDEGKVFDWAEPRFIEVQELGEEEPRQVQEHLYAKTLFIGANDKIENYIEVDAPVVGE